LIFRQYILDENRRCAVLKKILFRLFSIGVNAFVKDIPQI